MKEGTNGHGSHKTTNNYSWIAQKELLWYSGLYSTQDGNNKKVISEYKVSNICFSKRYTCILTAHSKNLSGKDSASTQVPITLRVFSNSILLSVFFTVGQLQAPWGTYTLPSAIRGHAEVRAIRKIQYYSI